MFFFVVLNPLPLKLTGSHSRSAIGLPLNVMVVCVLGAGSASCVPRDLSSRNTVWVPLQATSSTPPTTPRPLIVQPDGAGKFGGVAGGGLPVFGSKWKIVLLVLS